MVVGLLFHKGFDGRPLPFHARVFVTVSHDRHHHGARLVHLGQRIDLGGGIGDELAHRVQQRGTPTWRKLQLRHLVEQYAAVDDLVLMMANRCRLSSSMRLRRQYSQP